MGEKIARDISGHMANGCRERKNRSWHLWPWRADVASEKVARDISGHMASACRERKIAHANGSERSRVEEFPSEKSLGTLVCTTSWAWARAKSSLLRQEPTVAAKAAGEKIASDIS